jgi:hypothetical protein
MEQLKIKERILVTLCRDSMVPGSNTISPGVLHNIGDCRVEVTVQMEVSTMARIQVLSRQFVAMKMESHTWTLVVQVQGM